MVGGTLVSVAGLHYYMQSFYLVHIGAWRRKQSMDGGGGGGGGGKQSMDGWGGEAVNGWVGGEAVNGWGGGGGAVFGGPMCLHRGCEVANYIIPAKYRHFFSLPRKGSRSNSVHFAFTSDKADHSKLFTFQQSFASWSGASTNKLYWSVHLQKRAQKLTSVASFTYYVHTITL